MEEGGSDKLVLAPDLLRIMENTILTFHLFLKMDKRKSTGVLHLFANQNHFASPLQQVQSSLEKVSFSYYSLHIAFPALVFDSFVFQIYRLC